MKDKMSNSTNNNTPPEEFIEYLHNLLEEIIINNEELSRFNKWLKKYCDEYEVDFNFIESEILDFLELTNEYKIKQSTIVKKMLFKVAQNLGLTDNQTNDLLKKLVLKHKVIKKEIKKTEPVKTITKPSVKKKKKIKITDFKEILGLKHGDTIDKAYELFGKPSKVDLHKSFFGLVNKYDFSRYDYEQFGFWFYVEKATNKIQNIALKQDMLTISDLEKNIIIDIKVKLLGKHKNYILNNIYDTVSDDTNQQWLTYTKDDISVDFRVYEFNNYNCFDIFISWRF